MNHEEYDEDCSSNALKSDIIVTPKSLVSVCRIDSYFNPNLVPKVQVRLKFILYIN